MDDPTAPRTALDDTLQRVTRHHHMTVWHDGNVAHTDGDCEPLWDTDTPSRQVTVADYLDAPCPDCWTGELDLARHAAHLAMVTAQLAGGAAPSYDDAYTAHHTLLAAHLAARTAPGTNPHPLAELAAPATRAARTVLDAAAALRDDATLRAAMHHAPTLEPAPTPIRPDQRVPERAQLTRRWVAATFDGEPLELEDDQAARVARWTRRAEQLAADPAWVLIAAPYWDPPPASSDEASSAQLLTPWPHVLCDAGADGTGLVAVAPRCVAHHLEATIGSSWCDLMAIDTTTVPRTTAGCEIVAQLWADNGCRSATRDAIRHLEHAAEAAAAIEAASPHR